MLPTTYPSPCDAGPVEQIGAGDSGVKSLLQGLQSSVETNFEQIKKKLCDLEDRVAKVEEKQQTLRALVNTVQAVVRAMHVDVGVHLIYRYVDSCMVRCIYSVCASRSNYDHQTSTYIVGREVSVH